MRRLFLSIYYAILMIGCLQLAGCSLPIDPDQVTRENDCCEASRIRSRNKNEVRYLKDCVRENDPCAMMRLADRLMKGKGVKQNLDAAVCWYMKAANCGLAEAQFKVGQLHTQGLGVSRDFKEAELWYERAACQGYVPAMLALGTLFQGEYRVKPDLEKALYWYEKASERGSMTAKLEIGRLYGKEIRGKEGFHKAYDIFYYIAEQCRNPDAYAYLGDLYLEFCVGPEDLVLARQYYQLAAERGSIIGAFKLGLAYEMGQGVAKNPLAAFKWITIAAERGYVPAENILGDIYFQGRGVPVDKKKAAYWYALAMSHGSLPAEVKLADMYHSGRGAPRFLEKAAIHYQHVADLICDPYSELMLSVMYELGRGVPHDLAESVRLYKAASHQPGFLAAQYRVGKNFEQGFGLPKDYYQAQKWFILGAERGHILSQLELGDLYYSGEGYIEERCEFTTGRLAKGYYSLGDPLIKRCGSGEGITQNYDKAFFWYSKAAQRKDAYAEYMVGIMYFYGQAVCKNYVAAANWIRKAAYQCAREAQYQLGLMYLDGLGVPQSDTQAYAWIKLALEGMDEGTPDVIKALICNMGPKSREQAVHLAQLYEKKYGCHRLFGKGCCRVEYAPWIEPTGWPGSMTCKTGPMAAYQDPCPPAR